MNLFDTIKKNTNQAAAAPTAAPQASEQNLTGQTQKLLQAKSGKAVAPGSTPRISNVGEQVANLQTAVAQGQLAQQAAIANQQLTQQVQEQQAKITQAQNEQSFAEQKVEEDFTRNEEAIMDQYLQGQKQLDLKKDGSKFEQIGFKLRLQNDQYVDNLKRAAAKSQLDNDVRFKEELAKSMFADEMDLFNDNLDFRAAMFADKQEFAESMANMDMDYAIGLADYASKEAAAQQKFSGFSNIVAGGTNAYSSYDKKQRDDAGFSDNKTLDESGDDAASEEAELDAAELDAGEE